MSAVLPTCAELAGSRRTTTAMTNPSPFLVRSAASCSISARTSAPSFHRRFYALVVFRRVEIGEHFWRPRRRFCFVTMALHHLLTAALAFGGRQLGKQRSVVQHR